ncbi:hypothetical protein PsYK624_170550 [Phanerochaete sordida]|uniref:Uncharacterized protein n=1 Tax=Phanerochaete sordida TaxID=48140 RepID=A0A9P3LME4_9APHY|nr:hypothetical protein PsYK624_170550 [Phanerochaete sordida]
MTLAAKRYGNLRARTLAPAIDPARVVLSSALPESSPTVTWRLPASVHLPGSPSLSHSLPSSLGLSAATSTSRTTGN